MTALLKLRLVTTILLKLILEQSVDEQRFRARELSMMLLARELYDPDLFADVVRQIHHWIETTEGDGFLDLLHPR